MLSSNLRQGSGRQPTGIRNVVQGAVHGKVPAPVKVDIAGAGTRPDGDRCRAGEPGESGPGTEPVNFRGLSDNDGRRQDSTAVQITRTL